MTNTVKDAAPSTLPGVPGLIVDVIPKRARKAINYYVLGQTVLTVGRQLHRKYREKVAYAISLPGDDDLYEDVQMWLLDQMPENQRRAVRVRTRSSSGMVAVPDDGTGRDLPPKLRLTYDGGQVQTVPIDGHKIKVRTEVKEMNYSGQGHASEYESFYSRYNRLIFDCPNAAARDAVLGMLASLAASRTGVREPRLYVGRQWGGFSNRSGLRPRSFDTVVLPEGQATRIVGDMAQFLAAEDEYHKMGLPWHHGYLFWGPPGSGKTTVAQALATEFKMDVYWVPLSDVVDDSTFLNMIGEVQPRSILLLEDIDVVHASKSREDGHAGVTMAGLLNALDGMVTPHGMVTIMTTNHREVIDPAVIRAGRVDREEMIGHLQGEDLRRLIELFVGPIGDVDWVNSQRQPVVALPADVVGVLKAHIGDDRTVMKSAILTWMWEWTG